MGTKKPVKYFLQTLFDFADRTGLFQAFYPADFELLSFLLDFLLDLY